MPHSHLFLPVQQLQWWTPLSSVAHIGQEQPMDAAALGEAPHTTAIAYGQAA
jgi:hypothetical protein